MVRRLRGHLSGGPSRMRAEHLREWLWEQRAGEVAKVKANEAELEGEMSRSESKERESKADEGTADRVEEREMAKW